MTTDELEALIKRCGGPWSASRYMGCHPSTIRRYRAGRKLSRRVREHIALLLLKYPTGPIPKIRMATTYRRRLSKVTASDS